MAVWVRAYEVEDWWPSAQSCHDCVMPNAYSVSGCYNVSLPEWLTANLTLVGLTRA